MSDNSGSDARIQTYEQGVLEWNKICLREIRHTFKLAETCGKFTPTQHDDIKFWRSMII